MDISTLLLILLAFVGALGLSWFQYFYKPKNQLKVNKLLFLLRFLALFGVLLLLINPKITKTNLDTIKSPLVVAVDNSRSIKELEQDQVALAIKEQLTQNSGLQDKFDIQVYS